jgi:hypothetical protein
MRSLITILFFTALHISAQSGEILKDLGDGWYEVMGTSSLKNITPEQATRKAQDNACREAIEHFSGVQVSSGSSYVLGESERMDIDKYSQIINSVSAGIILEKIPISENLVDGNFDIEVKLKVKVGQQKGKHDPKFKLRSSLDREYYKHGLFSYYLMKGMRGDADTNKDKQITVGELGDYVKENVSDMAGMLDREQTPGLQTLDEEKILIKY